MTQIPYLFDEFFASGKEESVSPFLTPSSRKLSKQLELKTASLSAAMLALAFSLSFLSFDLSRLVLVFVYFLSGIPALIETIEDLFKLEINIDVLMTLAAFLSVLIGSEMEGALLLVLFAFSGAMENSVMQRAKGAIQSLGKISPTMAKVVKEDGRIIERSVKEIPVGTHLIVQAGEIVPLDGKVIEGRSSLNLSHLTGESAPLPKKPGDEVQAGSMNIEGALTIEVSRISSDSTLSRIIHLISQAQEAKPKLEQLFDRFGRRYAITIILISFLCALSFPFIFSIPFLGIEGSLYRALTFLIAASPCALIIATPTAYLSAINACAKKGILLKGGFVLDAIASCNVIAFDKTGTLTTGNLSCSSIESFSPFKPPAGDMQALQVAMTLERGVLHPMATAIMEMGTEKNLSLLKLPHFKSIPGFGLEGIVEMQGKEEKVFLGHLEYIRQKLGPEWEPHLEKIKEMAFAKGKLLTILFFDGMLFFFHFADELRPKIQEVVRGLKESFSQKLIMMTGDHFQSAKSVAEKVGIEEFYADLRPDDKLDLVAAFVEKGLAMVGDGINDAPALARSTVGISMGRIGSRTAIEASDTVLLADDLSLLHWLIKKARQTVHIVKQNVVLALCVILLATTPALLGFIPLWLAVILHEGGTVIVGFNSLRLLKK